MRFLYLFNSVQIIRLPDILYPDYLAIPAYMQAMRLKKNFFSLNFLLFISTFGILSALKIVMLGEYDIKETLLSQFNQKWEKVTLIKPTYYLPTFQRLLALMKTLLDYING